jgi:integrator complex subunit 11
MPDPPPTIRVLPLGAGQEVGRSCVVVGIGGATLMFDCGMHMGYNDARR